MELKGTAAIVTGGARGIGRGIAYELAKEGVRVAIGDLPATAADRDDTIAEIKRLGSDAIAIDCDVRDFAQCQAMAQKAVDAFGRLDILVNNAGVIKIGPVIAFAVPGTAWMIINARWRDEGAAGVSAGRPATGEDLLESRVG